MEISPLFPRKWAARLACLAMLIFVRSAFADNTGLGGTITYTDPSGNNPVSSPPYVGGYVVHTFTTNDVLTVPSAVSAGVLVVGGGGGGGGRYGCAGGAGGLIYTNLALPAGVYNATIGAGGSGTAVNAHGANGNNSIFGPLTALGGGGGGDGYLGNAPGQAGGSGGGGGGGSGGYAAGTATQPTSPNGGYGNNGFSSGDGSIYGGGGGAGAAASSANGGMGLAFGISGASTYYAGGGGGLAGAGTASTGGGGNGGTGDRVAGGNGVANTGGGGGGGWNAIGGNGGSGIVIVSYPYAANSPLADAVTSPAPGQSFLLGSAISATAYVSGGAGPYSVTYHYKAAAAASYTVTAAVGPFDATSAFAVTLPALPVNSYQIYATVTDSTANTVSSVTNTFAVSLSTSLPVQDANFETPGLASPSAGWAYIADVWNPGAVNSYEQNSLSESPVTANEQFTNTCPGGVDWYALINGNTVSITQDLLTNVVAGDTLSITFYGGRGLAGSATAEGGVFTATFLVGSTAYGMDIDTTVLTNGTWQSFTVTDVITNSGDLSLQFSAVSGDPWLDNISSVLLTLPVPVPAKFSGISMAGTTLTLTATGAAPNGSWTLLESPSLGLPLSQWTTNTTGSYDGSGNLSATLVNAATNAQAFFLLK